MYRHPYLYGLSEQPDVEDAQKRCSTTGQVQARDFRHELVDPLFLIKQKVEKPSIGRVFFSEFLLQQRKPYIHIHISSLSGSISSSFVLSFLYCSGMEYPALRNSSENIPLLENLRCPKAYMRPRMFRGCPSLFPEAFNAQSVLLRDVHGPYGDSPGSSRRPSLCPAALSGRVR